MCEINSNDYAQFNAPNQILSAAYNELNKQGIRIYKKCEFEKLTLNGDRTRIRKVTFIAAGDERLTIDCAALFWFDQKFVSKVNWFSKYLFSFCVST